MFVINVQAQKIVEKTVTLSSGQEVNLDFQFADQIIIKTWNKKEAYVKAIVSINDDEDNDKYDLKIKKSDGRITFREDIEGLGDNHNSNTVYERGVIVRKKNRCIEMEIDYEVYLPASVELKVESISGDIEIIGLKGPMNIETISGFIDLTISSTLRADFTLSTISGSMYSDLDISSDKEVSKMRMISGGTYEGSLNGGGTDIVLETISGDIYLRKEK